MANWASVVRGATTKAAQQTIAEVNTQIIEKKPRAEDSKWTTQPRIEVVRYFGVLSSNASFSLARVNRL